jgi:adenylosuccinate lyase
MNRDIYRNISPLDARYYASNPDLVDRLSEYLSEQSVIRYEAMVEAAMVVVMERYGLVPDGAGGRMQRASRAIDPAEVYREEAKTRHNIRALVNVMQRRVGPEIAPFIHLTATSEDVTGTAQSLRMREAFYKVVLPVCIELMRAMLRLAEAEAATVQIGRTHGQHAVPVTVGYTFAGYVDRLGGRLLKIRQAVDGLKGKLSGAVGAYNAGSLIFDDPRAYEKDVLGELGLEPAGFSSQIIEPEHLLDLMHALVSCFGILAQIGDDLRHLQRTEIGELGERFEKGQVGSSTMPHKRNPWNFEHVKSMWKEFMPRMVTRYLDQISEHQRDLTNSASSRFTVEMVTGFALAADRLRKQVSKLEIDRKNLRRNLDMTGGMFLAEPLYILLAATGASDAHEAVKQATLKAQAEGMGLLEAAARDDRFAEITKTDAWKSLSADPAAYTGKAEVRAREIAGAWNREVDELQKACDDYRDVGW